MAGDETPTVAVKGVSRGMRLVAQAEAGECGLACLTMIARHYGHDVDLASLRRRFSTSLKGMTLARMVQIAHRLGFDARPVRAELGYLKTVRTPCILHWDLNHFVVLEGAGKNRLKILDPARGAYTTTLAQSSDHFTGIVLEIKPSSTFAKVTARRSISLRTLVGRITGLNKVIVQVIGLAIAIELLGLIIPFQLQWVIDQVLVSMDIGLLVVISIGFLIVLLLQTSLTVARAWIISWFGATVDAQWATNLFAHLVRLPMAFFTKRHMGDVVSRFGSLRTIQTTVTGSFVETMLDGVMGTLALAILLAYSVKLTAVVSVVILIYAISRWVMFQKLRRLTEEKLIHGAKQQTELMESVRGIQAVKLANKQGERRARLENAALETASREMQVQRISMAFGAINKGLFGAQRVVLIALGAFIVIRGSFSAGMLIAFIAYADQFSQKCSGFIDKVVDLKMLYLHAERIADIALEEPEDGVEGSYSGPSPEASIALREVFFRYSDDEPWVLEGVNMHIAEGECVGIFGPSGCGKTTLIKVVMGLLDPDSGQVTLGGIDIRDFGINRYRELLAAVTQDDQLFAGTIAQNISFFDEDMCMDRVMLAARTAAIHDEVKSMPMGYNSLVGDMGSTLSGGQKQRVLLARALYRNPRILILDEATSSLDSENAAKIDHEIRSMKITRIVISHNKETIARTDRALSLQELTRKSFRRGGGDMAVAEKPEESRHSKERKLVDEQCPE